MIQCHIRLISYKYLNDEEIIGSFYDKELQKTKF